MLELMIVITSIFFICYLLLKLFSKMSKINTFIFYDIAKIFGTMSLIGMVLSIILFLLN